MSDLRIAVILGSTRPGRRGEVVADWVMARAKARSGVEYSLVDLLDYPLPHMDEPLPPSFGQYVGEHTKAWAETIGSYDGFIFITPEYNHSIPSVLKNAIDYVYAEWNDKAAGFVAYGTVGGTRAVEQLRGILSAVKIAHVHQQLSFSVFTDFDEAGAFTPDPRNEQAMKTQFDQVESWARALKTVRA
ncbi:NAD(P)H-dependent FMN reductase [Catenulispora sp. EB89]|uniref:NADPH-dependent FMN reductase n=1 Tax=Catenulispora sp. EB89 TaxID=3156257 RepID=UPI003516B066